MSEPFFHPWLMAKRDKGFMFAVLAFMESDIVWSEGNGTILVRDCGIIACSHGKRAWFDNPNLPWDKFNVIGKNLDSYTEERACRKLLAGAFNLAE